MIVKILGLLDILTAILFWVFAFFHIIPSSLVLILAFYLLGKGIFFIISEHFASAIDVVVAVLMFVSISFTLPKIVIFLVTIFLLQKGILSFF